MNQNCSIEYTATDGNGLQSTSTITWTIAPPGNFVIDGGDGSNVSGTVVKQAIANGDPLAITDGNGVATQLFNPVTAADIASVVAATDPSLVFDPATCTWEDPTGNFPTISVCVETETSCGVKPATTDFEPESVVDNGDGTFTFLWSEGWEVLATTTQTGGSGNISSNLSDRLATSGSWTGDIQVDLIRPSVVGCSGEYSAQMAFSDFDNTGSNMTLPPELAANIDAARDTGNMTDNGGGNWSMELPTADDNNGQVRSSWVSQNFQGTGLAGVTDVEGESHVFQIESSDPVTFRPRLIFESAVSVTTICGETLSAEDINGPYTGTFQLVGN